MNKTIKKGKDYCDNCLDVHCYNKPNCQCDCHKEVKTPPELGKLNEKTTL